MRRSWPLESVSVTQHSPILRSVSVRPYLSVTTPHRNSIPEDKWLLALGGLQACADTFHMRSQLLFSFLSYIYLSASLPDMANRTGEMVQVPSFLKKKAATEQGFERPPCHARQTTLHPPMQGNRFCSLKEVDLSSKVIYGEKKDNRE